MSPYAQRIAIAEACGWKDIHDWKAAGIVGLDPRDNARDVIPDYLNSLDAIHEAEKILSATQEMDFARLLFRGTGAPNIPDRTWSEIFDAAHAGAAIRAEAFLRTVGLWQPAPPAPQERETT